MSREIPSLRKGEDIEKTFFSPRLIAYQGSPQRGNNIDCVIMRATDSPRRRRVIQSILQRRSLSGQFRAARLLFIIANSLREACASSLPIFLNFTSLDQSP